MKYMKIGQALRMAHNLAHMQKAEVYSVEDGYIMDIITESYEDFNVGVVNTKTGEYRTLTIPRNDHKVCEYILGGNDTLLFIARDTQAKKKAVRS